LRGAERRAARTQRGCTHGFRAASDAMMRGVQLHRGALCAALYRAVRVTLDVTRQISFLGGAEPGVDRKPKSAATQLGAAKLRPGLGAQHDPGAHAACSHAHGAADARVSTAACGRCARKARL
jgi:hypothetical protein